MSDLDDITGDVDNYDQYAGHFVQLPMGDQIKIGKATGQIRELDGSVKGKSSISPIADTISYEVEFPDGRSEEYTATGISQNMYSQCTEEGNQFAIMQHGVGHKTDGNAVGQIYMYIYHGSNTQVVRETLNETANGWHRCVE
jgi:hypothetical protein